MCAINGIISHNYSTSQALSLIKSMNQKINFRGPDSTGIWFDEYDSVYLGHQRLSILDLSIAGNQPMQLENSDYIIVFNGEIYNYLEIKSELDEKSSDTFWKSNSDTEVLLKSIKFFGLEKALEKIDGMFAFALWNKVEKKLFLARDNFGEKPLYYGFINNNFMFSSDIFALTLPANFKKNICQGALGYYFKYNYIPSPKTIYENIFKLEPGSFLELKLNDLIDKKIKKKKYWSPSSNIDDVYNSNLEENIENLDRILKKNIRRRLNSDVEIGCFLSGGIDSSLTASIMQNLSSKKIKTFNVAFQNKEYDESAEAKKISEYLKTDHYTIHLNKNNLINTVENLPYIFSEPFSDSSQIPTHLVSNYARNKVKVAMSGDGADEIFLGYNRYRYLQILQKFQNLNYPAKKIILSILNNLPDNFIKKILNIISKKKFYYISDKIKKTKNIFNYISDSKEIYDVFLKQNFFNNEINIKQESSIFKKSTLEKPYNENIIFDMQYLDLLYYLPDDILCKVDRASMYNGLEVRTPYLSKELYNFSLNLPLSQKIYKNQNKFILKKLLNNYLPKKLFDKRKSGFTLPLGDYMKTDINEWCEDLLTKQNLKNLNIFKTEEVLKIWSLHKKGYDYTNELWSIINYINWSKKHNVQ